MKIVFICSSFQPGKDGVGDYTRRLAASLQKSNNHVSVIAVNDKYIHEDCINESQADIGEVIHVKRLSSRLSWNRKITLLNQEIVSTKPDWISLQYVPYGFHKKGIPFYLPSVLSRINGSFKWHLMFHEMWVGISPLSPFMHKVYGFLQKRIAGAIIDKLKPSVIHTSNLVYQIIQKRDGINSAILPLFSNICYKEKEDDGKDYLMQQLNMPGGGRAACTVIGIFGHLYTVENLYTVIEDELKTAKAANKKLVILSFGQIIAEEEKMLNSLPGKYPGLLVKILGEKQEEEISVILQMLDKGLSCTSYELIGKSGAFAAMKRHKLDVLVPKKITLPKFAKEIDAYNNYLIQRPAEEWDVAYVSERFMHDLANYEA